MKYEVLLKTSEVVEINADMFICEPGSVVFYNRPANKGDGAEEVKRLPASKVRAVKEI